ncbi:BadF/BadG/BcrA/BcrD ATPase family protein [Streptomyces sp. NPDC005438]|uniref:N-acetylglucosamine kinase n=1 Tax=Streptomyces sp. NPDC005438 TaxID=3156880 RepID=UPI0033A8969C
MAVTPGDAAPADVSARPVAVAVDAGNSKTDVTVLAGDGSVLATARGGGFQPPRVGVGPAVDLLQSLVRQALGRLPDPPARVPVLSACLANVDLPREERELTSAIEDRGWAETNLVANDTFAVLRAGLDDLGEPPQGVAVVCGAGVNCAGLARDGRTARFPALGRLSGDWGGGLGLAEEGLWHAARAEDGRGEDTALAREFPAHFHLPTVHALIEALHFGEIPPGRRHELAPVLAEVARRGDPVARSLLRRQAEELVSMIVVALTRLELLGTPTPVCLGGSVLTARHPELDQPLTELLGRSAPLATPVWVTAAPVLGAGLLALDQLGAGPETCRRLRQQHARPRGALGSVEAEARETRGQPAPAEPRVLP